MRRAGFIDITKAFDAMWLEDCMNDIVDTLPKEKENYKISLQYKSNDTNLVAVKTAPGLTERVNIPCLVQQGVTWVPFDNFGKKSRITEEHIYLYSVQ